MDDQRQEIDAEAAGSGSSPYEVAPDAAGEEPSERQPDTLSQTAVDAIAAARREAGKQRRDDESQFTLTGLLVLVTGFSLLFAPLAWVSLEVFAGIAGAAALLSMCVITVWPGRRVIVDVAWWCLLGSYVMVCGMLFARAW